MMSKRHEKIRHILRQCGLDAVLLVHPPNIRYLCGFSGTDGMLVISAEKDAWLLVDSRYTLQAQEEVQNAVVEECRGLEESVVRLLKREGVRRAGFEAEYMVVSRLAKLETGDIEWVALKNELRALR
ncbi:MAG: aminopeptidase P family N-terminal domain-containing protein, partial [Deltaproteobacteria bacterium]|nr:aminopeptidase P family N-terminal domain-containing protein [Deltaproteobacteria bacterium]